MARRAGRRPGRRADLKAGAERSSRLLGEDRHRLLSEQLLDEEVVVLVGLLALVVGADNDAYDSYLFYALN